ncbi:hypothetical protein ElyMa_001237500 [Elysia marginata]|uniref:Uncharacterized protein n=1 Tax=Elysia marginata TaxID=1093978 RepID=A0AAV4ID82_9GAST|nr:hypothetical protein ElyMa_001237500 [Elysia marginata]
MPDAGLGDVKLLKGMGAVSMPDAGLGDVKLLKRWGVWAVSMPGSGLGDVKLLKRFNAVVTPFLKSQGIAVLDGFNLTLGSLMSYDGTHYGKGLNDLKAQILLNYFREIRTTVS